MRRVERPDSPLEKYCLPATSSSANPRLMPRRSIEMNTRGRIARLWKERPAGRLDRKLFVVFLFLIILPIGLITYFAAERYTATIENNTVAYVSQLSSKMMGKLDDYVTDMMKISIIPSYLNEIQSGLELSNRHYQAEGEPKESASLNESELKLQITRKVERSIYFMNNIKEGTSNVYLFDLFGNPYYVVKSGGNRSNLRSTMTTGANSPRRPAAGPCWSARRRSPCPPAQAVYVHGRPRHYRQIVSFYRHHCGGCQHRRDREHRHRPGGNDARHHLHPG